MAEIKKLLDDAIETEIKNLNSASNKYEKSEVIKNLAALHKLRIEEIKTETEIEEKSERRAMDKASHDEDATLKAFQLDCCGRCIFSCGRCWQSRRPAWAGARRRGRSATCCI